MRPSERLAAVVPANTNEGISGQEAWEKAMSEPPNGKTTGTETPTKTKKKGQRARPKKRASGPPSSRRKGDKASQAEVVAAPDPKVEVHGEVEGAEAAVTEEPTPASAPGEESAPEVAAEPAVAAAAEDATPGAVT